VLSGLESAELKLIRAAKRIDDVRSAIWDYLETEPSGISKKPDGKYKLDFTSEPSPDIAILAGEALYQVRSALDHLAFDLVKLNLTQVELPVGWEKRCEFP
jgi:hypothetical protein